MRAGALVFLIFAGGSALVLFTDIFEKSGGGLLELYGERPKQTGEEPKKELTAEERVAALENHTTELQRRVRNVRDSDAALAGTGTALDGLIARLDELTANAGRLPRDDVEAQLDALERDFELRELMVQGSKEVAEQGPDEISKRRGELQEESRTLRAAEKDKPELAERLDKVDAALAAIEPPKTKEVKEGVALKSARTRFHKGVTTLREKLG